MLHSETSLDNAANFIFLPSDVLFCAYPRSKITMAAAGLSSFIRCSSLNYAPYIFAPVIEQNSFAMFHATDYHSLLAPFVPAWNHGSHRRLFSTHCPLSFFENLFATKSTTELVSKYSGLTLDVNSCMPIPNIVYVYRNVFDVCNSFWHFSHRAKFYKDCDSFESASESVLNGDLLGAGCYWKHCKEALELESQNPDKVFCLSDLQLSEFETVRSVYRSIHENNYMDDSGANKSLFEHSIDKDRLLEQQYTGSCYPHLYNLDVSYQAFPLDRHEIGLKVFNQLQNLCMSNMKKTFC
ncbi:ORF4 [White sturgeon adenovirus 1]|uniref:ORF4 n=1 Tax=White sturgeon adenovirus 1 TaxID=2580388 RepID=A0A4P8PIR1_9ADEN|nr:ORF4 [White sturgeon adenovirus 1]QCQ84178.1 ORF4 [White sturgeon adenovirus 1]